MLPIRTPDYNPYPQGRPMAPPAEAGPGQGCRGQDQAGPRDTGVAGVILLSRHPDEQILITTLC